METVVMFFGSSLLVTSRNIVVVRMIIQVAKAIV